MELKKKHQPPLNVKEQIENLKCLGLTIDDEKEAENFLNDVSYFRLIKAFSIGLKKKNDLYGEGMNFEEIKALYLFNANLRQAVFVQIEKVEINLRCRISNYFSCKYGVLGYEDESNFRNAEYHKEFLKDIVRELERNRKVPFVKNFQNNYETGKLPLYAVVELFSFGTLSKFYKNMKNEDKKAISQIYNNVGYKYLESWIEHITFVRNVCAHYGRLYNIRLAKTPLLYKEYKEKGISNNRVFAAFICLKYLLPHDRHWYEFVDLIGLLIEKYPQVKINLMGFPVDWKQILENM